MRWKGELGMVLRFLVFFGRMDVFLVEMGKLVIGGVFRGNRKS